MKNFNAARFSVFIVVVLVLAGLTACEPDIGAAARAIQTEALARSPALAGSELRVGGVFVNDPESCACFRVCDGNGENCTECFCDPEGCGSCDAVAGPQVSTFATVALNTGPLKVKLDEINPPLECSDPRPEDQGCTTLCKPCRIFVCIDAEWVAESIDFPEGLCDPIDPAGPRPNGCPRDETNFCPAECSFCF